MEVIYMTEGSYIPYTTTKQIITFDDKLRINLKNMEDDFDVFIDVCSDSEGNLIVGTSGGIRYVAQVKIPARTYKEVETKDADNNTITEEKPVAFDIEKCTLYLWALQEAQTEVQEVTE